MNQVTKLQSIDEFDLLSDGFFSDLKEDFVVLKDDEFDFGSDVFSGIEDELDSFSLSKYESVHTAYSFRLLSIYFYRINRFIV